MDGVLDREIQAQGKSPTRRAGPDGVEVRDSDATVILTLGLKANWHGAGGSAGLPREDRTNCLLSVHLHTRDSWHLGEVIAFADKYSVGGSRFRAEAEDDEPASMAGWMALCARCQVR